MLNELPAKYTNTVLSSWRTLQTIFVQTEITLFSAQFREEQDIEICRVLQNYTPEYYKT